MLTKDKQLIIDFIEENQEKLIGFLSEVVSIPSDNPPGDCQQIAEFINSRLKGFGFSNTSLKEISEYEAKQVGMIKVSNIVAYETFSREEGPEITLNSHGDVVPPGLGWTQDPYGGKIVGGKLYGRGAAVSKSDIATYTFATLSLRKVSEHLKGKISLAFTFDEEIGGEIGPQWLLKNAHINPDFAICPGFTYSVINAHNGCLHVEVKIKGLSAHAAEPQYGYDALEAMNQVLTALYGYRKTLDKNTSAIPGIESPTLVVGLINGGINTNVVPDECTIRIDRRIIPEENAEQVEKEIFEIAKQSIEGLEGVEIEFNRILLAKSFGPTLVDTTLVQTLSENWREIMKAELPVTGSPLYTDARHFGEAGIPVVLFGAGPRTLAEANGHQADEHVKVDDVIKTTKILALTLYDLLKK